LLAQPQGVAPPLEAAPLAGAELPAGAELLWRLLDHIDSNRQYSSQLQRKSR